MPRSTTIVATLAGFVLLAAAGLALAQPDGIHVIAGTYGASCGVPRGNVTRDLRRDCEGQQSCDYRVDVNELGDPANGCPKDYVAEWLCPDGRTRSASAAPEAGYGSVVRLQCWGRQPPGQWYGRGGISVISGTYGASCGVRRGNVTRDLAMTCNGRGECRYQVDVDRLGDPRPGCAKDYYAQWQCGDGRVRTAAAPPEAGYGSVVTLSCWRR